jgi:hypothetical protein
MNFLARLNLHTRISLVLTGLAASLLLVLAGNLAARRPHRHSRRSRGGEPGVRAMAKCAYRRNADGARCGAG